MTESCFSKLLNGNDPVIRVVLSRVRGSSPRDVGTEMFVTSAETLGTIGGGQLEYQTIVAARELLGTCDLSAEMTTALGPEIGQCCGGRVSLTLTRMSDADRASVLRRVEAESLARPHVYIMGSGHVGRAMAALFQHMPFRTIVVDQREEELAQSNEAVEKRISAMPETEIAAAPPDSAFIVLTHDHALDFLLTGAALERCDAAYVGLIGSATKRARFENWFRQHCGSAQIDALVCPIGKSGSGDKRPEIIAAFVVAEVSAALLGVQALPASGNQIGQAVASARRIPARAISGPLE